MGANEKHDAAYHGGEYVPVTDSVRVTYVGHKILLGVSEVTAEANFDRWLEGVRSEVKAEAFAEYDARAVEETCRHLWESAGNYPLKWDDVDPARAEPLRAKVRKSTTAYREQAARSDAKK